MNATTTKTRAPRFKWREPKGCTTPRGWCAILESTHADYREYHKSRENGWRYFVDYLSGLGTGNYLTYTEERGPNGESVHWVAFYRHFDPVTSNTREIRLGAGWVHTIEEARAMIEGNVRAYLGLPREG